VTRPNVRSRRGQYGANEAGGVEANSPPRSEGAKRTRQGVTSLFVLGALIWTATPVAGLVWIASQNRNAAFVAVDPAWVPVAAATDEISRTVDLGLAWRKPDELIAPAWTGTVQQVFVTAGAVVSSGTPVARIDGVDRLAWGSPGVFYRPLAR